MKRSIKTLKLENKNDINSLFIDECENFFKKDPINTVSRNAVTSIGSMLYTTDSNRVNDINHIFLNTIKKKDIKATNQGSSGRCWIFSGLNMFRHSVITNFNLNNFEFSETYLFFWDKFERANMYLRWFIDHPDVKPEDESFKFIVSDYTGDGGWWNMFANLVSKYGLVPKSSMKETFHSDDSNDMNEILNTCLQTSANYLFKNKELSPLKKQKVRIETLRRIYCNLVKFLGEPPKKFRWSYTNDEDVSHIISDLTPHIFKNMVIPDIEMKDFIVLTHLPGKLNENQTYEVKHTSNVYEGNNFTFLNLKIDELSKYACKSILSGLPVWFAADITKDFNPYHSALDDKLVDDKLIFDNKYDFNKADKINFHNLQANHAMSLIGVNFGSDDKPESWQVENSWGFFDNETPGDDGFLYMSNSWFKKNVMQIVVHKNYLTRSTKKLLNKKPIQINPWDCVAPALKINVVKPPYSYIRIREEKKRRLI